MGKSLPMPARTVPLCELADGQEADFFALLSEKQELKTRDGKPYYRVTFRDARREVGFPDLVRFAAGRVVPRRSGRPGSFTRCGPCCGNRTTGRSSRSRKFARSKTATARTASTR